MKATLRSALEAAIREVPDFPTPGIAFKDITPVLSDPVLFGRVTGALADAFVAQCPTHVAAIESRGFLLGGPIAQRLATGLVPVRKPGKLPGPTETEHYSLEYGSDALQIHRDAFGGGARVLIVDDVLATGGTILAARRLVERLGAEAIGCAVLIELAFLDPRKRLGDWPVHSLVQY
jgi:adenine phosphoribosyltransferase